MPRRSRLGCASVRGAHIDEWLGCAALLRSNRKLAGGATAYLAERSLPKVLGARGRDLFAARRRVVRRVKAGAVSTQGTLSRNLPYNWQLANGRNLGGTGTGLYMPAMMQRYRGPSPQPLVPWRPAEPSRRQVNGPSTHPDIALAPESRRRLGTSDYPCIKRRRCQSRPVPLGSSRPTGRMPSGRRRPTCCRSTMLFVRPPCRRHSWHVSGATR